MTKCRLVAYGTENGIGEQNAYLLATCVDASIPFSFREGINFTTSSRDYLLRLICHSAWNVSCTAKSPSPKNFASTSAAILLTSLETMAPRPSRDQSQISHTPPVVLPIYRPNPNHPFFFSSSLFPSSTTPSIFSAAFSATPISPPAPPRPG